MKSAISAIVLTSLFACASSETLPPDVYDAPSEEETDPPAEVPEADPEPEDEAVPPVDEPEDPEEPGGFDQCATQYDEAKLKPLDIVLLLDRSGSMAEDGKWGAVTTALQQFAANPESDGIGVSLGYFPETYSATCVPCNSLCGVCFNGCCALPTGEWCWDDDDCDSGGICSSFMCHAGGGNATCEVSDYETPEVALSSLPGAAGDLNISIANTSPAGGTPTGPALQGALSYASSLAAIPESNEVVVVLATDGEPTECQPQAIGDVASLAADAATAVNPISTFVIGVGANMFNLNVIAAAGGTQQAYLVDANANATQSFLDSLNDIRRVAVACQYTIPDVDGAIAYDLVNVAHATNGQTLTPIGNVPNEPACAVSGGWYYDDPNAPTSIVMCPSTCEELQNSHETQVEIVYGCETIVH